MEVTEAMRHWTYYQTKTLAVVPYMEGCPVYRDGLLNFLYTRTKAEGKLEMTFHEEGFNGDKFVAYFEKLKLLQVLCEVEEDKTLKPVGYAWVSNSVGVDGARSALCGFCFFNGASKRDSARNLARLGLAYWMMALKIDVVHGVQIASNIPARNFAEKLGFVETGIVPKWRYLNGELVDCRAMLIEAKDFLPKFHEWKALQQPVTL